MSTAHIQRFLHAICPEIVVRMLRSSYLNTRSPNNPHKTVFQLHPVITHASLSQFPNQLHILLCVTVLVASCSTETIAQLKDVKVELKDEKIKGGLDNTIKNNQRYLESLLGSEMTPEIILRLADMKIKKELDILEGGSARDEIKAIEKRNKVETDKSAAPANAPAPVNAETDQQTAGTREAIALYRKSLKNYPNYEQNDHALYQLARIYEELGNSAEAMNMMDRLVKDYPHSHYTEEIQFRRGENNYAHKNFPGAKDAYQAVVAIGKKSPYYEFALYKSGWTLYKQEQYEAALQQFIMLLDFKVSTGYDLDHPKDAFDEKRIDDIYRAVSLCFSYLGGADAIGNYFDKHGKIPYESSVYKNMGNYYLEKLRYGDAATTFQAFVKRNPYNKLSPYFDIWAIDSFKTGGFPKLVIESNKNFVANYGLKSAYWTHFKITGFIEVTGFVKNSLKELANYYHAQYQDKHLEKTKEENLQEAVKWYRELLVSFPKDPGAIAVHYQLADLLLENKSYVQAAIEYEHIAYDYPAHERSAEAGYAAIYALRKNIEMTKKDERNNLKREVVRSSLRFAEAFPKNEKSGLVMGAALDDIYAIKDYPAAAATARKIIAKLAGTDHNVRRSAWLIFSHSSFELGNYKDAEEGYLVVLGLIPQTDPVRADIIENLAASFYKQGERASKLGDYKTAATYFFLVGSEAPTAKIRSVADFDGITALIQGNNLTAAADALKNYRASYPGQQQSLELSKKLALAYKESGELVLAAAEYERLAEETKDVVFQRAALELAAELYSQARELDKAYPVYKRYVSIFPKPLEYSLEMHNNIATYLKTRSDMNAYIKELEYIMKTEAAGGAERTDRSRFLGAKAALDLAEFTIRQFAEIKLESPYADNLKKKQAAMKVAKDRFEELFDYETDVVTSAATYYLAEMYYDFNRALITSERPFGLSDQDKEKYNLSLEEQAYPFEKKAIEVHQKNLELMSRGIYNSWIERSIEKLAKIMPARYAKYEESSGYIRRIDDIRDVTLIDPKRAGTSLSRNSASSPVIPQARELTASQKDQIEADFSEAMQSLKLVQYEKAIKLLSGITALSPNNPVPYVNLALIDEKKQDLDLAEENLKLAIKVDPEHPVAGNEYALLLRKTGRFADAKRVYEKMLETYPDFLMARKNLGILCDIYMKDYQCALQQYLTYSKAMPEESDVKGWIADLQGR